MPDYRRWRVPGGTHLFTINLLERRSDLLERHFDALREAVRRTRRERPFHIDAWVVLPEHPKCLWTGTPPKSGGDGDTNRLLHRTDAPSLRADDPVFRHAVTAVSP